jgi:hypothetical protein
MDRKTEGFITDAADIIRQNNEIKTLQTVGQDSYVIYTEVSDPVTYTFTSSDYRIKDTITFTSDFQKNAFAELNYIKYVGSVSPGNEDPFYSLEIIKKPSAPDTNVTEWEVGVLNLAFINVTFIVYYYVLSFDTGEISV